jgi:hypothetical protein
VQTHSVSVVKLGIYYLYFVDVPNLELFEGLLSVEMNSVVAVSLTGLYGNSVQNDLINGIDREIQIQGVIYEFKHLIIALCSCGDLLLCGISFRRN